MTRVADIAVVMPAHNEEPYIERALRSVLNQGEPRDGYEIIVVDDGSTDATARIVQRFEEVTLLRNAAQAGLPASLNAGIRAASARFVVRVDADDYVHHDFLHVLKLFLELNPHMEAIACDYMRVDEHEQHLDHCNASERPIGCGIMFRKERVIEIGLYDEDFLMAEDLDLRLRFERRWPIHRCELPLYRYRLHGENMTHAIAEHEEHIARALAKNDLDVA